MVLYHPDMIYANFHVPDSGIQFLVRLSGFSKSTHLESTCYGEFLDAKIFPDKLYPETDFDLNLSFSDLFFSVSLIFIQNDQNLRLFMSQIFTGRFSIISFLDCNGVLQPIQACFLFNLLEKPQTFFLTVKQL